VRMKPPRPTFKLDDLEMVDAWMKAKGYEWRLVWSGGEIGKGELVVKYWKNGKHKDDL